MTTEGANNRKRKSSSRPSLLVLGVGNVLMSDEGLGVRVAEMMKDMKLPGNVEVLDGGTASFDLLDSLAHREKVVIVDAAKGGSEPGTLYRFTPDDVVARTQDITSLHQVGLSETLIMAKLLGCHPQDVVILGIEPMKVGWGLELSPEVAAMLPRVIEVVLTEIGVGKRRSPWSRDCAAAHRIA